MGYVIGCHAPRDHGKTTTIKSFCEKLESMPSSSFEILYERSINDGNDILKAYRRYGVLIFAMSGGDFEWMVENGYNELQYACGGLECDILICAATQNPQRQTDKIRAIEEQIEHIAKRNGHWLEWLDIEEFYDDEPRKESALKNAFFHASKRLTQIGAMHQF